MEPITRQEQLLDSIATGNSVELEPITREEQYLSAIAGLTDFIPEKSITRKEMFYEKILESGGVGGDGTAKPTQTKTIKVVENGTYKVTPDSGKVLSSVTANVNVPERYEEGFAEGKEEGYNEGYNKGFADNEPVLEALTATENKEYTPSDNVDGFNSVTVNVPLKYDEGFQAGVDSVKLQEKTATENGDVLPDEGFNGMSKVTVAVPTGSSKEEQEKSITITENGTTEVTPDEGKTLSKVTVETNVAGSGEIGKPYLDTSQITDNFAYLCSNNRFNEQLQNLTAVKGNINYLFKSSDTLTQEQLEKATFDYEAIAQCSSTFDTCKKITKVDFSKVKNSTAYDSTFYNCSALEEVKINLANCSVFYKIFDYCRKLKNVEIVAAKTNLNTDTFKMCTAITDFTIGEGWAVDIYLTYSTALTQESLHGMIENLADLTGATAKTFSVGATNLAKIDEEHIAMLQTKNWNYS